MNLVLQQMHILKTNIILHRNQHGYCHVMIEWINLVWAPFCNGIADGDGAEGMYLLMDDFLAHTASYVVQAIQ